MLEARPRQRRAARERAHRRAELRRRRQRDQRHVRDPPPQLGHRAYYELYLTRHGRIAAPCGTFTVHAGTTKVHLNAPYQLRRYDGWVVTKHVVGQPESSQALLTT